MPKQMLIETSRARARIAIVEDGVLLDYDVEEQERESLKGNIYKGIITNVERGLAACFVDFGVAKQGFLPFNEIRPDALIHASGKPAVKGPLGDQLRRHQEVVVQVTKEEIGHKGAALSCYLSFPGRYCVLMHSEGGRGGISRKIENEEQRQQAKEILDKLKVPEGFGVIIRTAGMNRPKTDLQRDLSSLQRTWRSVEKAAKIGRAPTLLYREPDMVVRTIRDYLLPDIDAIIVDDPEEYEEACAFFDATMPKQKHLLQLYQDSVPLFTAHGIDAHIARTAQRGVRLPSGGEIVIDQTEAMVTIDVNSSRSTKEKGHEETVYKTNLEAADEVARQLRLRDLGGLVVIDFIDHASRKHDRAVEKRLRDAVKPDKARCSLGRISKFGLLEMTRQRLRRAHSQVGMVPCPTCDGAGAVQDPATRAQEVLRELRTRSTKAAASHQALKVHVDVETANLLFNALRDEVDLISRHSGVQVQIHAESALRFHPPRYEEARRTIAPATGSRSSSDRAQPAAGEASSSGEPKQEPTTNGDGRKRRRRRRSKRGGGGTDATETAPAAPDEAAELADDRDAPSAETASVAPLADELSEALFGVGPVPAEGFGALFEEVDAEVATEPTKRKRRRRRRRKTRADGVEEDGGNSDSGDQDPGEELADAASVPPPATASTAEVEG